MTTAAIVIGALLLLAMVGISVYGAITLPSDARIRCDLAGQRSHHGPF